MDIRSYFSRKRSSQNDLQPPTDEEDQQPPPQKKAQSASSKRQAYRAKLSYKKKWEDTYHWVTCIDPADGMFCSVCQEWGKPPSGARGAWTTRGITDWNHATELLKQHANSQWHRDSAVTAAMAQQVERAGQTVADLQCSVAAREAAERRQKNCVVIKKLLRSTYFLVKNRIAHTTVFVPLLHLQIANGDDLLEQHIREQPANAQYTSKFSVAMMVDAIDTWLERRLLSSLKSSHFFSILADECQDICTQEELSICCRWIVDGRPEEHFLTTLHVRSTNAAGITEAITTFVNEKKLDYKKLVGQGYDGAATFAGVHTGVQRRIRVHAAHALYIHCSCHKLQLASIQSADSVATIKRIFGTMTNLWKMFYYSPKKAEALKSIQLILNLPELKVVKPSDTRWLSHERCIRAILKELPALITTLHQFYEDAGDAEAYGLALALGSYSGVATIVLLSVVLDLLAKLNCSLQRKAADFSKLPTILKSITDEVEHLKDADAEWCTLVGDAVNKLEIDYEIALSTSTRGRNAANVSTINEFREAVAIPYINSLLSNINIRFSDTIVKLLTSSSVFNPDLVPTQEESLAEYGKEELQALVDFYGEEAKVEFDGTTYISPPLVEREEVLAEWKVFKRAFSREIKEFMKKRKLTKPPSFQVIKVEMESSEAYADIFPAIFRLMDIILSLPVGTATVERSFSQMKLVKTRLRSRLSDNTLPKLMRIAIEGPELSAVDFNEILAVFKEKNHRIEL